ncbi:MAG TPA: hypothetical protein PKW66_25130, partial [Polyangiaceae bacterium]|nr:hypothetical protein [Polyangiaceae bacterium]
TLSRPGECEGCEREGKKTATYTLRLQDASSGKEKTCSFSDPEKWKSFQVGSSWKAKVGGISGGIDCDSLTPGP